MVLIDIENIPEIEAIPVDWIKMKIKSFNGLSDALSWQWLINMWEDEKNG